MSCEQALIRCLNVYRVNFKWKRDKFHAKPEEITPVVEEKQIVKPAQVVKAATVVKEQTPDSVEIEYYEILTESPTDVDLLIDTDDTVENNALTNPTNAKNDDEKNSFCVTQDTSSDIDASTNEIHNSFATVQKGSKTSFLAKNCIINDNVSTVSNLIHVL